MYSSRLDILPACSIVVALALALSSCSSKRVATSSAHPHVVGEITLDDFVGEHSYVMTPDRIISPDAGSLIEAAQKWLGTKYKYGGETRRGVDCSALVMNVYREALGMKLPRTTKSQREFADKISKSSLQPGDLIFFTSNKNRQGISHVGLFVGNDRFIHASSSRGVVVSSLNERYYREHYHSAGRVLKPVFDNQPVVVTDVAVADRQAQLDSLMEMQLELLDQVLTATIDSIYSMPVDDDPNLAPGL